MNFNFTNADLKAKLLKPWGNAPLQVGDRAKVVHALGTVTGLKEMGFLRLVQVKFDDPLLGVEDHWWWQDGVEARKVI